MRPYARTSSLRVAALFAGMVGCAGPPMRVPEAALTNSEWKIEGYAEESMREPDFTLGEHAVRKIRRVNPPSFSGNRTVEPGPRRYRFELASGARTLQAECSEVTDPRKLWIVQFGNGTVHLTCGCFEQGQQRAQLTLADGEGFAQLTDGAQLAVTAVHQTAEGKHKLAVLGYALKGPHSSGAVERSGHGRAWPTADLEPAAGAALGCIYASLLLYRPAH